MKKLPSHLIEVGLAIQNESALDAGKIGFYSRALSDMCLPTKNLNTNEFVRRNGHSQLTILSPTNIGLPNGTYPRLILIWIFTQATIKKSRQVFLGSTVTEFIRQLGKKSSGGKNGSITAMREQSMRLFASTISVTKNSEDSWSVKNISVASEATVLWNSNSEWNSNILLNNDFYQELVGSAYPIDMRAVDAFSNYPFALDIYLWLTSRYFRTYRPTPIGWSQLENQFGNSFANSSNFRQKFKVAIDSVAIVYPTARYKVNSIGLMLFPSPPHVPNPIAVERYG